MAGSNILLLGGAAVVGYLLYKHFSDTSASVIISPSSSSASITTATAPTTPFTGTDTTDLRTGLTRIAQQALVNANGNSGQFRIDNGLIMAQGPTWDYYAGMLGYYGADQFTHSVSSFGWCTLDYYLTNIRNGMPAQYRNAPAGSVSLSGLRGLGWGW